MFDELVLWLVMVRVTSCWRRLRLLLWTLLLVNSFMMTSIFIFRWLSRSILMLFWSFLWVFFIALFGSSCTWMLVLINPSHPFRRDVAYILCGLGLLPILHCTWLLGNPWVWVHWRRDKERLVRIHLVLIFIFFAFLGIFILVLLFWFFVLVTFIFGTGVGVCRIVVFWIFGVWWWVFSWLDNIF